MTRRRNLVFAAGVILFASRLFAGTCAMCRQNLESGGSAGLVKGIYWSIVVILGVPLVILALGVRYAWRHYN